MFGKTSITCITVTAMALLGSALNAQETTGTAQPFAVWNSKEGAQQEASAPIPAQADDFDILSCPFAIFREAYLGVFETPSRLAIMALEEQAISACAKRQAKVNLVLRQERELRVLLAEAVVSTTIAEAALKQKANAEVIQTPEPSSDALTAQPDAQSSTTDTAPFASLLARMQRAVVKPQAVDKPPVSCIARYGIENAPHQRWGDGVFEWATLSDHLGENFVVKAGDLLPGNLRVTEVSKRGVFVKDNKEVTYELARAPYVPPEVIDLSVIYKITSIAELDEDPAVIKDNN